MHSILAVSLVHFILGFVGGYFVGSIPTGYLVARAKGVDIRSVGSGNIGATNVFRILGKKAGILVLAVDAFKGVFATTLLPLIISKIHLQGEPVSWGNYENLAIICGVAAVLGHNYTCWLKFKGGKGIATSAGVFLGLAPAVVGVLLAVWLLVFAASKYVSLASVAAAVSLPIAAWIINPSRPFFVISCFLSALAIYKHKANIQRLMAGTENRFGKKKEGAG